MGAGEVARPVVDPADLKPGEAITGSGRISAARMHESEGPSLPFTPVQLAALDDALTLASRTTGLDFSVYLGELGGKESRAKAEQLHAATPRPAHAVLVAVSPGERVVEVVTGEEAHRRLADRGAKLAVMSMIASFKEGDLSGGIVGGLRMLTDQAGRPRP
ncbi:DUF5130 family protein [Actinosynnema pretiosum subsp. pretiosum]|uniref:DUF5130 domain-containing protein n=2 Tax=Actinosynnema TaxID=40566 RepID=C6WQ40_ACTMD|nr:DUF5130 family protein [Actinosynnema mirum]ACU35096.1 hypothetical protein Amir_1141 [Actinosynnema mirum DSM 43827]AXX28452.1 hypothetical protein APASM_1087 [Actinosynnema pretiosum subsp. pretiosum]QUF07200.1 DUF5130 family protein [Actinosynnema pretiosum subsp. pretiosum]